MLEYHLTTLYKSPGVHSVDIEDIIHCLLANCVLLVTGTMVTYACVNLNICTILVSVIEGSVHATLA